MRIKHECGIIDKTTGDEMGFVLLREHPPLLMGAGGDELELHLTVDPDNVGPEGYWSVKFDAQEVFDFLSGSGMEARY